MNVKKIVKKFFVAVVAMTMACSNFTLMPAQADTYTEEDLITKVNPILKSYDVASNDVWVMSQSTRFVVEATDANIANDRLAEVVTLINAEFVEKEIVSSEPFTMVYGQAGLANDIFIKLVDDVTSETDSEEAYKITISTDGVVVEAANPNAVLYALRTIQALMISNDGLVYGTILDYPDVAERRLHVDCARKYISKDWFIREIREMSYLKLNTLQFHFSENLGFRIECETDPAIVSDQHLTKAEVREILAEANKYGIEVIPSFDSPGHVDQILKVHPEYGQVNNSGTGYYSSGLDVTNEEAVEYIYSLYDEYMELFEGCKQFHIGGDEYMEFDRAPFTTTYKQALNDAAVETLGEGYIWKDVLTNYINELAEYVYSKGFKPRVWNDGIYYGETSSEGAQKIEMHDYIGIDYWSHMTWNSAVAGLQTFIDKGHTDLYNINGDYFYYILRNSMPTNGNDQHSFDKVNPEAAIYNDWTPGKFQANTIADDTPQISGAAVAIWCDNPDICDEDTIFTDVALALRTFGSKSWNTSSNSLLSYDEFVTLTTQLGQVAGIEKQSTLPEVGTFKVADDLGSVIIKCIDGNGNSLQEDITKYGELNSQYSFEAPAVYGYRVTSTSPLSGTYSKDGATLTFTYELYTDKTALNAELEDVIAQDTSIEETYEAYANALSAAQVVAADEDATQQEVDEVYEALMEAKAQVVANSDYALYSQVNYPLANEGYTSGYSDYEAAIEAGKEVLYADASSSTAKKAALDAIIAAKKALMKADGNKPSINTTDSLYQTYTKDKMLDGDPSTFAWFATGQRIGAQVNFTFATPVSLSAIEIIQPTNVGNDIMTLADVMISTDNVNWTTVGTITQAKGTTQKFTFDETLTKYVRIQLTASKENWYQIAEVNFTYAQDEENTELIDAINTALRVDVANASKANVKTLADATIAAQKAMTTNKVDTTSETTNLVNALKLFNVEVGDGVFKLNENSRFVIMSNDLAMNNELLINDLKLLGSEFIAKGLTTSSMNMIYGSSSTVTSGDIVIELKNKTADSVEESYTLDIQNYASIAAYDLDGIFYGVRDLQKRLILDDGRLEFTSVDEVPGSKLRAFHLDAARKEWSKDWIIALIKDLSYQNYNSFQFHFSENEGFRIQSDVVDANISNFVYPSGTFSKADILDIIEVCKQYHVDFVPSLDSPGHMRYLLQYLPDSYNCDYLWPNDFRSEQVFNIFESTEAKALLTDLFKEYIDFFSEAGCKHFNIGGDEFFNDFTLMTNAQHKQVMDYFNEIAALVKEAGMTPRAWNDGLRYQGYEDYTLDSDIEICYWSGPNQVSTVQNFIDNGHKVINYADSFMYYVLGTWWMQAANPEGERIYNEWHPGKFPSTTAGAQTYEYPYEDAVLGASFAVWCDSPNLLTQDQVATNIFLRTRATAYRCWYPDSEVEWSTLEAQFNKLGRVAGYDFQLPEGGEVFYEGETGTVTIKYVDEDGNAIHEDKVLYGRYDDEYSVSAIDIYGYKYMSAQGNLDGVFSEEEVVITLTYALDTNKEALAAKLEEANAIDQTLYTEDTAMVLQEAMDAAQAIMDDENATQKVVDNAVVILVNAIAQLKELAGYVPELDTNLLINTEANKNAVSVIGYSSQCTESQEPTGKGGAIHTLDYVNTTYWHSDWGNAANKVMPQYISYDLGKSYYVQDIQFLPRQGTGYLNGDIFEMNVYVSDDTTFDETDLVGNYEFENNGSALTNRDWQRAFLGYGKQGQYVKVEAVHTGSGEGPDLFASMSEIRFYGSEESNVPQVDKAALLEAMNEAKAVDTSIYTVESVEAFTAALTKAQAVYDDANATQAQVNKAKADLVNAQANLQEKVDVNKDALTKVIADAKAIDTTKYTDATVAALTSALTAAESVNANENATQDEVDAAVKALTDAIAALAKKPVVPTMDFYDVQDKSAWFYGSVEKAFTKGLMGATGKAPVDGKPWFEPDTNISRAMVATVLYRMAGQPKVEFKATFKDVTDAKLWYSTAITWAAQNGVVSGYKDGRFGPDDNITRQDLAIMLRNYAKSAGLDTNVTVDFAAFKDGKQVVDYAASAVAWCVEAKLMSGSKKADGTYLMPTANATRAECAKMFSLLDDAIKANTK